MATENPQPHPLTYQARQLGARRFRFLGIFFLVTVGGLIAFAAVVLAPKPRTSCTSLRESSACNLRQIGQAILMYQYENHGLYPRDLPTLVLTEDIQADAFIDPRTNDTAALGPTTKSVASTLLTGGHCSYDYVGAGCNQATLPSDAVVAYEKRSSPVAGGNVLFGDGRVEYCDMKWWIAYNAKVANQGTRKHLPVTMPSPEVFTPLPPPPPSRTPALR